LMLKCLMLMRLHTVARSYHHFIDGLRGRSRESMQEQRIREVEMGSFTPLVFSTFGGMGHASTVFYKRLAFLVSLKRGVPYS